MKKVLFAIMAIVLCVGLIGGAFAYFTDTHYSTGNTFTAGTTKLSISTNPSAADATFNESDTQVIGTAAAMAPGHNVGPFYVFFKNDGNIGGVVTSVLSYTRNSDNDALAQKLDVTAVNAYENGGWVGFQVAGLWALQVVNTAGMTWAQGVASGYVAVDPNTGDNNTTGYVPTIYGLQTVTLHFNNAYAYQAPWGDLTLAPAAFEGDSMSLMLDPSALNPLQGKSLTLTVTGLLTSN